MASYEILYASGELQRRVEQVRDLVRSCSLCPRNCRVDRLSGNLGACGVAASLKVSSVVPHFGEEPPLSGWKGAGAIFFSHCNLKCLYCQNYEISREGRGKPLSPMELAQEMIRLEKLGCHNIDLVSPTHMMHQILEAIHLAAGMGLTLPLVYNTGGYDSLDVLRFLEGVVDIYLPDMKYATAETARRLSGVSDYPCFNQAAVKEMFRQTGPLRTDEEGIARRGVLVRHLVLPGHNREAFSLLEFVRDELSSDTPVSLMSQYHPIPPLVRGEGMDRPLAPEEYEQVLDRFQELGLTEGYQQELSSRDYGIPSFREQPDAPFRWEEKDVKLS